MGLCNDNATSYLAKLGFSVVRIPRENINPLDLVGRDRDQMVLGTLDQLLVSPPGSLPEVKRNQKASNVNGQTSSKLKLGIGISVLGNILGAMAGTSVGIKGAYDGAKTLQFEFQDVVIDSVLPLAVGRYLRDVDIDVGNPVLERYVMGKGQLFLITEVLRSASITVKAEASTGSNLALKVPTLQGVASGDLSVDVAKASLGVVTYSGPKALAFGFKSLRVGIEDGNLSVVAAAPDDVALAAGLGVTPEVGFTGGLIDLEVGDLRT